jgi:hypothetical protein
MLAEWLLAEGRARHVVFAPLPPMDRFPLLPQPLRWALGADARRHDAALARWTRSRTEVSHIGIALELGPDVMAPDGFHPGEPVYRICGEALAMHIADAVWPRLTASDPTVDAVSSRIPADRGPPLSSRPHQETA